VNRAFLTADLQYGDSGKGTITDALTRRYNAGLVVRFSGGAQAAHSVVLTDGTHHIFSQWGAGTFAGAATHLSRFMLVEPFRLFKEADVLISKGAELAISVDPDAVVTTSYHILANQALELRRGANKHGSVGLGIGETRRFELSGLPTLRMRDIQAKRTADILTAIQDQYISEGILTAADLRDINPMKFADTYEMLVGKLALIRTAEILSQHETVIFENAQGVLLDEKHGFAPYNTWTNTTFDNGETLACEAGGCDTTRIGIVRTYMSRHGAGPFVTEASLPIPEEPHNKTHKWMGHFRVGHFDAVAARYAIDCCDGIDELAITHADTLSSGFIATNYNDVSLGPDSAEALFSATAQYSPSGNLVADIAEQLNVPLGIVSTGPTAAHKLFVGRSGKVAA